MGNFVANSMGTRFQRLQDWAAKSLGLRVDEWQFPQLSRLMDGHAQWGDCIDALEQGRAPELREQTIAAMTLGEGYFFRHARQFELLRLEVLPALIQAGVPGGVVRVLSVGCGAGEEAYSLAILLEEACRPAGMDWQVEAVDLCEQRLQRARAARYGDWSLRSTPGALRRQYFIRHEAHYEVLQGLRERVRFSGRNLCDAAPDFWREGGFDLVFCRNVLGRMELAVQQRGLDHLAAALKLGGLLFLGGDEALRGRADLFLPQGEGGNTRYQRSPGAAGTGLRLQPGRLRPGPSPLWLRNGRDTVFELWRQQRLGQALHLADSLTMRDRSDTELMLAQIMLLLRLQRVPEAQRLGVRLLAQTTTPGMGAAAHYAKALGHELRAELQDAESSYRQAARLDAGFALPHLRLGLLARQQRDTVTARQELGLALDLLPHEDERRLLICGQGLDLGELLAQCRVERVEETA